MHHKKANQSIVIEDAIRIDISIEHKSGIIGHVIYAVLALKAAEQRQLAVATAIRRHWASDLAGSYPGCDIQTPWRESA